MLRLLLRAVIIFALVDISLLLLDRLDEGTQRAYTRVLVLMEVEVQTLAVSDLQKVVVERLLAHANLGSGALQRILHAFALAVDLLLVEDAVIQEAPAGHELYYLC